MNNRKTAIITGWSLIMMAIIAGFSIGYAFSAFYQPEQINSLKDKITNNQGLYQNMLIGICIILILDLLISYTLFAYFRKVNKTISLVAGILRIVYTLVFGLATYYLANNLNTNELNNEMISRNFQLFQSIWSGGLVIFGFHIILIGVLMKIHRRVPKTLWYLTLIAGVSYITVHLLKLTNPDSEFVSTLEMILVLPIAIGELGLAIWLIVKGGKEKTNVTKTRC
ncbi:MAG: DUF4386 domain-containing protein [Fluviicola sp.]|nr:DUF4386 domain-containing protein [Fluviicola sp.]